PPSYPPRRSSDLGSAPKTCRTGAILTAIRRRRSDVAPAPRTSAALGHELPEELFVDARAAPADRHAEVGRVEAAQAEVVLVARQHEAPALGRHDVARADDRPRVLERLVGRVDDDGVRWIGVHGPRCGA